MTKEQWKKIRSLGGEGILQRSDLVDLKSQRARVLWLMLDGLWHTATEILVWSRGREGLRRMRELREIPHMSIQRQRLHSGRDFMYRLQYQPGIQQEFIL